ncbi:MAG TPA: peptide deformylase, partial [Nitrospiria bacterium]|nr:peptide deformylase [Nitrospiria bacterium]
MAVREILQYPHPVLKQRSRRVKTISPVIHKIIRDMWDTTEDSPGVALAAPQIGLTLRIIVCDVSSRMKK